MRAIESSPETEITNLAFRSRQVGDFTITAFSDGYLAASLDLLSNIDPADASRMLESAGARDHTSIHINCYLVRGGGCTALIDAGAGGFKQWGGRLTTNLALAGIQPSEIEAILLTHAHPDHVGGLTDGLGNAMFPNAELVAHHREVAFWQDDGNLSRTPERAHGSFLLARRAFDSYRDRLRIFDAGGEVLPGITTMPFPGHTPGHSGYRLDSGGRSLLVWGDIVHFPSIQVPRPDVSIAFDQDSHLASETRSRLLDLASSEGLLIAGMHLGELGFAHIERKGGTYGITYA